MQEGRIIQNKELRKTGSKYLHTWITQNWPFPLFWSKYKTTSNTNKWSGGEQESSMLPSTHNILNKQTSDPRVLPDSY